MKNQPVYSGIPVDYAPMQDLSIDIKTMPQAFGGYHLLLVITCDQTNFTIAVLLRDRTAQTVAETLGKVLQKMAFHLLILDVPL